MVSDNPTAAGGSSRRHRTPPTLDLKAEDVRADTAPETTAAPTEGELAPLEATKATAGEAAAPVPPPGDGPEDKQAKSAESSAAAAKNAAAAKDAVPANGADATISGTPEAPSAESTTKQPEGGTDATAPEAPAETPAQGTPKPRRGGAGTVIAALVLGALAGGAAGAGVFYYVTQQAPRPATVDLSPIEARIAVLEARPVADPQALAALRESLGQADVRFNALDSAIATLKAAPAPAASGAAALSPNVDALKAALGKTEAAVADVSSQVAALKASQDGLKSAQDGLRTAVASATTAAQQAQGQAQGLTSRLDGLNTRIDTVRKEAADAASDAASINRGAAAVLVLGTLKQSVDAGRPFAQELQAARTLLGPRVAALEPFAPVALTGFPSLPKLADQLLSTGNGAIDGLTPAPAAPAEGASLVTRFLASAQNLVKVRPADGIDPDSLRGVLNRAVAAVRTGDIESALATLKQLPEPVQQKLTAVVAELDARRRAAAAAATLYQQALAAISGKAP